MNSRNFFSDLENLRQLIEKNYSSWCWSWSIRMYEMGGVWIEVMIRFQLWFASMKILCRIDGPLGPRIGIVKLKLISDDFGIDGINGSGVVVMKEWSKANDIQLMMNPRNFFSDLENLGQLIEKNYTSWCWSWCIRMYEMGGAWSYDTISIVILLQWRFYAASMDHLAHQ